MGPVRCREPGPCFFVPHWRPQLHHGIWIREPRRKNANHRIWFTVEQDRPANHVRIGAVTPLPQSPCDYGGCTGACAVVGRRKHAPQRRIHTEHRKQAPTRLPRDHLFGKLPRRSRQVVSPLCYQRHRLKAVRLCLPVEEVRVGDRNMRPRCAVSVYLGNIHQLALGHGTAAASSGQNEPP